MLEEVLGEDEVPSLDSSEKIPEKSTITTKDDVTKKNSKPFSKILKVRYLDILIV